MVKNSMFGFGKTKKQILKLSEGFLQISGFSQQNRIYVSQLQNENEYFRTLFKQLGIPIEERSVWLAKQADKEQKLLDDMVTEKVASELAKGKIKDQK